MICANMVSKTQMIQTARQNANNICLKERSSGIWLEEQIRIDIQSLSQDLSRIESRKQEFDNKKCFLPVLNKFILIRTDEAKSLKTQRVRKIIQLLCIVLLRIKYRMYAGALGILLFVGILLEDFEPFEHTLGGVVYSLIRNVSLQISISRKNSLSDRFLKRHNRGSFGNAANCPLLYNVFREKMEARLRKSQLIVEKTFGELIHNREDSLLKLPEQIHPNLENYRQITVNIDRKSLIFSYEYPKVLQNYVPLKDYRFFISKLNTVIVPEARCYSYTAILRMFYNHISGVFLLLCLLTSALARNLNNSLPMPVSPAIFCVFAALILLMGALVFWSNSNYKNPLLIHKGLSKVIQAMTQRYWSQKTVFRLGDSIQCFHIYLEDADDEVLTSSSDSESSSSESEASNQRCSLKQFFDVKRRSSIMSRIKSQIVHHIPKVLEEDPVREDDGTDKKTERDAHEQKDDQPEAQQEPNQEQVEPQPERKCFLLRFCSQRVKREAAVDNLNKEVLSERQVKSEKDSEGIEPPDFEYIN